MPKDAGSCPTKPGARSNHGVGTGTGTSNRARWPKPLRVDLLHQHPVRSDPMDEGFDDAKELRSLGFVAPRKDLT